MGSQRMIDGLTHWLLEPSDFAPLGACLQWQPILLWLAAASDFVIGAAYFTVPLALLAFLRQRRDMPNMPLFGLFVGFILLSGMSHLLDLLTLFVPAYSLATLFKTATAIAAVLAAAALWRLLPRALMLPSPHQLRELTEVLAARDRLEAARKVDERKLERSNTELERLARHLERARDDADRANRAKSRFLAGMSHELRTPLNGILGYAQLLRMEGGLNAVQSERVEAMLGAGTHLLQMIHCVLDMSEIEAERVELQATEVDPRRATNACIELIRPGAEAKHLTIGVTVAADVPRLITTDATRLRQVLLNLLGNAVKFTIEGSIAVRVETTPDALGLRIEVADTGPGVPVMQRNKLFQDFGRLDADITAGVEGAGLGLAISCRLVALLGGRMGHEDNAGGGSVFWLELPFMTELDDARLKVNAPFLDLMDAQPVAAPETLLHVLVVDDVEMNRDIAASFIRAAGHRVSFATGGTEAVALCTSHQFDVVLMDVRMPDLNGLEATRRIRMLPGDAGRVAIVALTAQAFTEQVDECRRAGMNGHVAKPFTMESLLAALEMGLDDARCAELPVLPDEAEPLLPTSFPSTLAAMVASGLPVLNPERFQRTADFLDPEAVAAYMQTIAGRSAMLLHQLRQADARAQHATRPLAEAAHTLAGSAGMFGFERLADAALHYERAVQNDTVDTESLASALGSAIEVTLQQIRLHPSEKLEA
jgi:signal transduction histidine kinase/DNA-binding NarL/FixJ family response regulator/HPt (histidine-containing phosphotransfer) domain-containing protein